LVATQNYRSGALREVCVVVNGAGDINKLRCETFFSTHVLGQVPINISTLVAVDQPFDMSVNTDPGQAFTSVSVDQNFWFFYQSPDNNFFNLITDANVSFLVTTNLIQIKASDFNQTIQPYVVPATLGISVIFTTLDPLTNDIVPSVVLKFSRTISGVGNVDSGSGITDTLGRLSLPFVPTIDHNFTVEFPGGTVLQTGTYNPQTVDATNGIKVLVPLDQITGDTNSEGVVDINFLQSLLLWIG